MTTALINSTNFESGIWSYITISPGVSLPTQIAAAGGTGTIAFDSPNTFINNLITQGNNYRSTGILLFYFDIQGTLTIPNITASSAIGFNIQKTTSGTPESSVVTNSIIGINATSLYPTSTLVQCNLSDFTNAASTGLNLVITNNNNNSGTLSIDSIAGLMPVLYLPNGFQTT